MGSGRYAAGFCRLFGVLSRVTSKISFMISFTWCNVLPKFLRSKHHALQGGNVPSMPVEGAAGEAKEEANGSGMQPGQQQRPSGQPGRGRGSHAHKDKHKAAIANHHRKDRALRKMGPPA